MKTAKIFKSGNSQAVRIPKEFKLEGTEIEIERHGDTLVLRPRKRAWIGLKQSLEKFTADFMAEGRKQPPIQSRPNTFR